MYLRSRPADKKRVAVTKQDAARIDEQLLIAQNEAVGVISRPSLESMKDLGVTGKEWVTAGDDRVCEICLGNQDAGVIPVGRAFPSGHMHLPGCERCRCVLAPAILNRKD
jgi:hypothetical protein